MAKDVKIQKSVRGEPLPLFISSMKGVQAVVRERAFEIEAESKVNLIQIEAAGTLEGKANERNSEIRKRRVNRYAWMVSLFDPIDLSSRGIDRGSAAINIEEGRRPYIVKTVWRTKRGRVRMPTEEYGGMKGLFIIANAVKTVAARHRSELR